VLHTDTSVLPRRRRAWASWNYHVRADAPERATVTYDMNILQGLDAPETFCVTLNETDAIDPAKVLGTYRYHHPVFGPRRATAQRRHAELIRNRHTSYCGAWWGYGFHEDGVQSALRVGEAFGRGLPS
jgi:predicted NAD/FAD-binding protein